MAKQEQINWPFYPDDYQRDTKHLKKVEHHGAYILLLMHYWQHGALPNDDEACRKIAKVNRRWWPTILPTVKAFFNADWKHKRVERDLKKAAQFRQQQSHRAFSRWEQTPVDKKTRQPAQLRTTTIDKPLKNIEPVYATAMPILSKKDILSYRANPPVENQPSQAGSLATALPPGALARQPTRGQKKAQQAWERDLLQKLGAKGYAKMIDQLANRPALCDRATQAEMRKPGEGLQVIAMGLQRQPPKTARL